MHLMRFISAFSLGAFSLGVAIRDNRSLDSFENSLSGVGLNQHVTEHWRNRSAAVIAEVYNEGVERRQLLAYSKLGKLSTLSFIHIARTGGLSFNKIMVENRGIFGRDGNRAPDCIIPRAAYGNDSLPLASRFDFPNCEIISAIWPLPTVQVCTHLFIIQISRPLTLTRASIVGEVEIQEGGGLCDLSSRPAVTSNVAVAK